MDRQWPILECYASYAYAQGKYISVQRKWRRNVDAIRNDAVNACTSSFPDSPGTWLASIGTYTSPDRRSRCSPARQWRSFDLLGGWPRPFSQLESDPLGQE